jgi:hypothetical protein
MKLLYFFLFLWVIFALLDPEPAVQNQADPCGSGSEILIFTIAMPSQELKTSPALIMFDEKY